MRRSPEEPTKMGQSRPVRDAQGTVWSTARVPDVRRASHVGALLGDVPDVRDEEPRRAVTK